MLGKGVKKSVAGCTGPYNSLLTPMVLGGGKEKVVIIVIIRFVEIILILKPFNRVKITCVRFSKKQHRAGVACNSHNLL